MGEGDNLPWTVGDGRMVRATSYLRGVEGVDVGTALLPRPPSHFPSLSLGQAPDLPFSPTPLHGDGNSRGRGFFTTLGRKMAFLETEA